ncbi:hypothetical protein MKW98_027903 [Papaver atlanticum]|uniref:Uncharacterized protein n=1 Tax=Papaver atlanticum TaxID=357466 RepID=A0AAD4SAM7_9MAGN|nr:hypothetical protein MKW98_027903 [Papaver atlanticum]
MVLDKMKRCVEYAWKHISEFVLQCWLVNCCLSTMLPRKKRKTKKSSRRMGKTLLILFVFGWETWNKDVEVPIIVESLGERVSGKPSGVCCFGTARKILPKLYTLDELKLNDIDPSAILSPVDGTLSSFERLILESLHPRSDSNKHFEWVTLYQSSFLWLLLKLGK